MSDRIENVEMVQVEPAPVSAPVACGGEEKDDGEDAVDTRKSKK